MTIIYDLAKRLKDAGFPQESGGTVTPSVYYEKGGEVMKYRHIENDEGVKVPTLSDLIDAFPPEKFQSIETNRTMYYDGIKDEIWPWKATAWGTEECELTTGWGPWERKTGEKALVACSIHEWGRIPEESVANLWLALYEKQ